MAMTKLIFNVELSQPSWTNKDQHRLIDIQIRLSYLTKAGKLAVRFSHACDLTGFINRETTWFYRRVYKRE